MGELKVLQQWQFRSDEPPFCVDGCSRTTVAIECDSPECSLGGKYHPECVWPRRDVSDLLLAGSAPCSFCQDPADSRDHKADSKRSSASNSGSGSGSGSASAGPAKKRAGDEGKSDNPRPAKRGRGAATGRGGLRGRGPGRPRGSRSRAKLSF